jgi:hypothetical protein
MMAAVGSKLRHVRVTRMSELPLAMGRVSANVKLEVKSDEELKEMKLWEQGDASLYSVENLEKRYANRSHKGVWKYLNLWWDTALTSSGLPADSPTMPKQVYIEL